MVRKTIPADVENQVLLRSRRRCCLCFWLDGIDEVVKGQIAHLDRDPSNSNFDNLVFVCFNHHDEYDGKTSQSKGLRTDEVKQWRDELYKEMQYRFRTGRNRKLELEISRFIWVGPDDQFAAEFRLKNTGETQVRNPTVSVRLPPGVSGKKPVSAPPERLGPFGISVSMPMLPDFFGMQEYREDLFERSGRVGIARPLPPGNPVLLPGHSVSFEGLGLRLSMFSAGSTLELEYRIDAEDMAPLSAKLTKLIPQNEDEWMANMRAEWGLEDETE